MSKFILGDIINFVEAYHKSYTPYKILKLKFYRNRMLRGLEESFMALSELEDNNRFLGINKEIVTFDDPSNYRIQEYEIVEGNGIVMFVLIKDDLQFEAYLSLGKTTFILFIITISALLISKDATALVLQPLESIMLKVNEMAEDPFQILKF